MESPQPPKNSEGPNPRPEVENMHAYSAPLEGRRKLLRLDFNENTIGPSPLVVNALQNIPPEQISIYPEYNGLREALVKNLKAAKPSVNIKPTEIGLFNGVDAAIHAIFQAYGDRGDYLLTTTPTFGYYTPCAHMQGMQILSIPYQEIDFKFPIHQVEKTLLEKKPKLLLICNPNNPTGTRLQAKKILELSQNSPNTLVVVDELYEAFTGDSVLPIVDFAQATNLLVLRSLSKTAGLAGLRIGFAIGNHKVIEKISRVTGPYDVNSLAVTAAFAALRDQAYIDNYVSEVLRARDWIKKQLLKCGKRHHIEGGNYLLIWPANDASKVEASLKSAGVLVRNMKDKPLIEGALRVSIGTTEQMKRFWQLYCDADI